MALEPTADAERWERVQSLFLRAIETPAGDRAAFVDEVSEGDAELRHELTSLLRSHDETGLMDTTSRTGPSEVELERIARLTDIIADRYSVREQIGRGGMATVLLAEDLRHGREVALKVLRPEAAASLADRHFRREIEISARLRHPHILPLFDSGEVDGIPYFVMPYVKGESLRERLDRVESLPVDEALRVALEVADALGYAHSQGVVHRDIKPGNVMLEAGHAVVADFGIGSAADFADGTRLTKTGVSMGTPAYMSPEQISGQAEIDARSDLYSLACVLYEMIAGRPPFQGRAIVNLVKQHVFDEPPRLTKAAPSAPEWLADVVARALSKDPAERFQSAADMVEALSGRVDPTAAPRGDPRGRKAQSEDVPEQEIRFCTAPDGVRIAYAVAGEGPPLVKTANWLNHLEYDWRSPIWAHFLHELIKDHRLVRYDARANGLSDWDAPEVSFDAFVSDLETVADAAGLDRFPLLGVSQGCPVSIAYAVKHPERVTRLVLYGGYARGRKKRSTPAELEEHEAILKLMERGWGREDPAYRQIFTSRFIPDATQEQAQWYNDLQRITASPENAVRIRRAIDPIDVEDLLPQVRVPTLVLHCRGDAAVPFEAGRRMAAGIPGARFVALEGRNHLILEDEPAWPRFLEEIRAFLAE